MSNKYLIAKEVSFPYTDTVYIQQINTPQPTHKTWELFLIYLNTESLGKRVYKLLSDGGHIPEDKQKTIVGKIVKNWISPERIHRLEKYRNIQRIKRTICWDIRTTFEYPEELPKGFSWCTDCMKGYDYTHWGEDHKCFNGIKVPQVSDEEWKKVEHAFYVSCQ